MSETPPLAFSVIIPTLNRKETLLACLETLSRQTSAAGGFDVIVVDDGSTDGTEAAVREGASRLGLSLTYLRQERQGPGAARNRGAERARGSVLAFTEDDVRLDPRWLERAAAHFQDETTAALEGKTLLGEGSGELRLLETGRQFGFVPCNWFVRRSVFQAAGGYRADYFDPETKLYFREDADFGFRLLEAGKKVVFADDVIVTHPALYRSGADYLRHARRYFFDALLCREHPRLFRSMIEVKRLGVLTIRRPFHYLCTLYLLSVAALLAAALLGSTLLAGAAVAAGAPSLLAIWYRYERRSWNVARLPVFLALPFVYYAALLRGCVRFGSFGALR